MSSQAQRPPIYKRRLLVDRKIQVPLMFYVFSSTFIGIMAFCATTLAIMMFFDAYVESVMGRIVLGLSVFTSLSIFIFTGLYVTNKVAGPIFRLRQHIRDIADGNEAQLMVGRDGDFIEDLISDYNRMAERLKKSS